MATAKIAITLEKNILQRLDLLVKSHFFPNRSKAIQEAVQDKLRKIEQNRLEIESLKLNKKFEQALSEEGFSLEADEWPEY
jgi:metal-responsive CopG/Arc/MetJ family transcriptional regulator